MQSTTNRTKGCTNSPYFTISTLQTPFVQDNEALTRQQAIMLFKLKGIDVCFEYAFQFF